MRSVYLDMTGGAVVVLQVKVMLRTAGFQRTHAMVDAMTFQAKLRDTAGP